MGGAAISPRFIIEAETNDHYRRFNLQGRTIRGRISGPPPPDFDPFGWIEEALRDLHSKLCARADPNDHIGLTITSSAFTAGPLWYSFRRIREFSVDDLWNLFYSAAQSARDFSAEQKVTINCAIVSGLIGAGRVRLVFEDVNKKSILKIRNDDGLCLARSLVTAFAHAVRGQIRSGILNTNWHEIRQSRGKKQKSMALDLSRLAGVAPTLEGCGLDAIHKFQIFFATKATALIVFAFETYGHGSEPLYNGSRLVLETARKIDYMLYIYCFTNDHGIFNQF